jgi:hypothetical protein
MSQYVASTLFVSEQNMKEEKQTPRAILEPGTTRMQQSVIIFRTHIRPYVTT